MSLKLPKLVNVLAPKIDRTVQKKLQQEVKLGTSVNQKRNKELDQMLQS